MATPTVSLATALSALKYAGPVKSSTKSKGTEVLTWLYKTQGNYTTHVWGYDPNAGNPEHHSGYALDFMTFTNKAMGDKIAAFLWANRARLGVKHIIWQQHIKSTQVQPGVNRPMPDRGSPTANHRDHVHVTFLPTAYKAPSAARPPASPIPSVGVSKDKAKVIEFQRILEVKKDGKWGVKTDDIAEQMRAAARGRSFNVRRVQAVINTKIDGQWGPNSRGRLGDWVKKLQHILGVTEDRDWGPKTESAYQAFRKKNRL